MSYKVAIVGATGVVGHEFLKILHERQFPVGDLVPLASRQSAGRKVSFGDADVTVQALDDYNFTGTDIVLSSAGGAISAEFAERAGKQGALVIDNTSHFRMDKDVPLIVPEVNPEAMSLASRKNIIANPNCSTIQMVVALKPLHDAARLKRVIVSTYQSVSGAGKDGMDELFEQSRHFFVHNTLQHSTFAKQIAFNVIPQIDAIMDDGHTKEELKMVNETRKIFDAPIDVAATCVRVPVFIGHAVSIHAEFENPLTPKEARQLWSKFKGVSVIERESDMEFITPFEIAGEDNVFISRTRASTACANGLMFWCVADNVRKGAALNAIQIAELWAKGST